MNNFIKRKDFNKIFAPYNDEGTQIWVITRVKKLHPLIVDMALRLADLEFIKYVRICDETLAASSENYPKRPKVPITHMNHETATGVQILYYISHKTIDFFDINSKQKGNGSKMVDAILKDFPTDWSPAIVFDWSDGFWDKMIEKYNSLNWIT